MGTFEKLWIARKCGIGMGPGYILRSFLPLAIIFLITAILVFAMIFISSVSDRIDRMLEVLGSGSIYAYAPFDGSLLPAGAEIAEVVDIEALLYAKGGERAVIAKGVDDGYLAGMRGKELGIGRIDASLRNPIVVSSSLADELGLVPGDRLTMMVYEKESGRTRPLLATVAAVFDSVYPQLDSRLAFIPLSILGEADGYEILLPEGSDVDSILSSLLEHGVPAASFKSLNREAYMNVRSSLSVLYLILFLIAALAAFFSADAAEHYVSRDRKDIAELMVLGAGRGRIVRIYMAMTLLLTSSAIAAGTVLGMGLSLLSPSMIGLVARSEPAFLDYYVRSFSISIPWLGILCMLLLSIAVSAISVRVSLGRSDVANILVP